MISVLCFVLSSLILRYFLDPNLNLDYFFYFDFKIFQKPEDLLSFFLREPYLYGVYSFFDFFCVDKVATFLGMYWFNYLIGTAFFVWLLTREDVQMWKKMFLFSCYYFFFTFVLLRNGPVYILFAYYFYYTFREKRFDLVLLSPFAHVSSLLLLLTYFNKKKFYLSLLLLTILTVPFLFFLLRPLLCEITAFQTIVSKVDAYSTSNFNFGILHQLFFFGVIVLLAVFGFVYKKQIFNNIIITTVVIYVITFFINPLVGFRYSPYVFFALFLYDFEELLNAKIIRGLNLATILLFPGFLYALFHTHHL